MTDIEKKTYKDAVNKGFMHGVMHAIMTLKRDDRHDAAHYIIARMVQPDHKAIALPDQRDLFLRALDRAVADSKNLLMW